MEGTPSTPDLDLSAFSSRQYWEVVALFPEGFPGGSLVKKSACSARDAGDAGLTPGLGRSLGERHGNPF